MSANAVSAAGELLGLWERAASVSPAEREDVLLAAAPNAPLASLGARNAALLALRVRLFGEVQPLRCDCPGCGAVADFAIDCTALSQTLLPATNSAHPQRLEGDGHRIEFRLPDVADLRHARARAGDAPAFVAALLERCVIRCERDDGRPCAPAELPASLTDALSRRMEELEPGASVSFDIACPDCGEQWAAAMDVGDVLWSELQSRAERLLLDIDVLARAYGWSESGILALSPIRRAAYLQLLGAA